jgi:hypothetical protein
MTMASNSKLFTGAAAPKISNFALISALTEVGKGRTATKLRSYLRAAYSLAISSKTDPDAPLILRSFGIEGSNERFARQRAGS